MTLPLGDTETPSALLPASGGFVLFPIYDKAGEIKTYICLDWTDERWAKQYKWYQARDRYVYRNVYDKGKHSHVAMHRELLGLEKGDGLECDHLNGDPTDNRRSNLRVATRKLNMQNLSARRNKKASKHRGVDLWTQRGITYWRARVQRHDRRVTRYCKTEAEAIEVAKALREEHLPFSNSSRASDELTKFESEG